MARDGDTATEAARVFRSDTLLAKAFLGRGPRLCFVVFDPMVEDHALDRTAFGERFLAAHAIDAIHILSTQNGWYQDQALPALLAKVARLTAPYERVVAYGSSMGGYAALRFAASVGARAAIAISPQYSMLPAVVPFENRWTIERDAVAVWRHDKPGDRLPPIDEVVVFYDDRWLDRGHVEAIRRDLPHAVAVAIPYAGHPAGTVLAEAGILSATILDAAHGRLDAAAVVAALRRERRRSAHYLLTLARRQPLWRLRLKAALAHKATLVCGGDPVVLGYAALAQECAGHVDRALALHAAATRRPGLAEAELRYARALWRAGQRTAARAAMARARQVFARNEELAEIEARMALLDGDDGEGIGRLVALAADETKAHRSLLARGLRRIGQHRALRSRSIVALARRIAAMEVGRTMLSPRHLLRELTVLDRD